MKRTAYLLVAVLLIAGAGLVAFRTLRGDAAQQPGGPGEPPAAGTGPARVLLNEILVQPSTGQPPWVELVNAGGEAGPLDGVALASQAGEKFTLPSGLTLLAGGVLLVRFDGQTGTEANLVHAPATALAPEGFIQLSGSQGPLDRIAWGDTQPAAASLSRGGYQDALSPGTSLGRVPRTILSDPIAWVSYGPLQATPGRANPQPGVEILLPMDGAIVMAGFGDLAWYPVAGAARYRVQVAADPSFGSPLLDQTVTEPSVTAAALAQGSYVWRVQAIAAGGTAAEYSPPSTLTVRAARGRAAGLGRLLLDRLLPAVHAQTPPPPISDDDLPTVLDVPLIQQHKDTAMLLLETRRDTGAGHAWDEDHGRLARPDPADNMNCAPASVAMLSQYYHQRFNYPGRLSQDRLNYEVFHADVAGPQGDLNWGRSYNRERLTRALAFAFGVPPIVDPSTDDDLLREALWRARISQGMPAIACKNRHCVAVVGAGGSPTLLVLNDPGVTGTYLAPVSFLRDATVFVMARPHALGPSVHSAEPMLVRPRSDEPEVSRDSDGDGVVDFDEVHRFHTDPTLRDTDKDELPDKQDIRASVHDPRHGFAYGGRGRDFDGDGTAMELDADADADAGGCIDGWEDPNKNGLFEPVPGETDNFNASDDACISGSYVFANDSVFPDQSGSTMNTRTSIEFSLREVDGAHKGRATVTYSYRQRVMGRLGLVCAFTADPYQHVVDVRAEVKTAPDGTVGVIVDTPEGWTAPMVRVVAACPDIPAEEHQGPEVRIAGLLRNGVYDVRADVPLGADVTGTQYEEIHMRQGGRR